MSRRNLLVVEPRWLVYIVRKQEWKVTKHNVTFVDDPEKANTGVANIETVNRNLCYCCKDWEPDQLLYCKGLSWNRSTFVCPGGLTHDDRVLFEVLFWGTYAILFVFYVHCIVAGEFKHDGGRPAVMIWMFDSPIMQLRGGCTIRLIEIIKLISLNYKTNFKNI